MLKTYYRQKFRVRNLKTRAIVNLNQRVNKNGNDIMVGTFESFEEAQAELNRFLQFVPHYKPYFEIESFSDSYPHDLDIKNPELHKELAKAKVFSGKGLAENTNISKRDENKYQSGRWYGKEVHFAQSAEHNKGISLIHKLGAKNTQSIDDTVTFERLKRLTNDGSMSLQKDIVDHMIAMYKHGDFSNRKEMKVYLRDKGYTSREAHRICNQMFIK